MFGRLLGLFTIYTFLGAIAPRQNFPGTEFTLHPTVAFFCIGSITARHSSSSGHHPNFAAWYKEWNYGTFSEGTTYNRQGGYHVGHQPTF